MRILPADFYFQDTVEVSRQLLGKLLVHEKNEKQIYIGRIVETEAYLGNEDPACHSYGLRRTPRVETMYLPGGHSYVYFIYGMYFCFNVVTGDEHTPEAVLVRAVHPLTGLKEMQNNRNTSSLKKLADGPGKLCQAFEINSSHNGLSLFKPPLTVQEDEFIWQENDLEISERIGLGSSAGDSCHWPLRFRLKSFVSN